MPKKRKRSAPSGGEAQGPNMNVGNARKHIRDFEDVADSADEFELGRDRILLDEDPVAKRRRREREREEFLEVSDEEVLDYDEEEEDVDKEDRRAGAYGGADGVDGDSEEEEQDEYDDEEGISWGLEKGELYGADAIETEEQALEEEAEALRLQKKQLQAMTAADYGFDEAEWQDTDARTDEKQDREVVTEVLPQLHIADDLTPAERLKILKSRYPEFEPLAKELVDVRRIVSELQRQSATLGKDTPNFTTKFRAASAYAGALTMYFALLASPALDEQETTVALSASQLRNHPVMYAMVRCRDLWGRASKLPHDKAPKSRAVDPAMTDIVPTNGQPKAEETHKLPKKSRAERHAEAAQVAADERKAERLRRTEADLADLDALIMRKSSKKHRKPTNDDGDIGEEIPISAHDAAEKAKRKKSLRFYTSQIAQKSAKRGSAGRNAGGDEDIPYRERLRDRQARLNTEAEARGRRGAATDTTADLGGESDEDDTRQARAVREQGDEDYYDLIAARTQRKKDDKAAFASAQARAAAEGGRVIEEETVGADGKRKVTYMIEKNKGLTPHRKKEARNPRVKKRKKFEEKSKRLGSTRAVFKKGGEGRGGYGGELTGIKTGLVKSTKF